MSRKLTVLLVDDHKLVRLGFRRILEDEPDIEVVAEAGTGDEAVPLTVKHKPDVLVLDCALPGKNGLDVAREVKAQAPETKILMLSMHAEETWVRQSMDAGATGYILKSAGDLDLVGAVRKIAAGEQVMDPGVERTTVLKGEREQGLTPRELQIVRLIVDGKSNKEIAAELDLSVNTVAVHRANIMESLGIHKTAELVVYAIRNGLVTLP